jgi:predicted nucleic acid-binding protein
MMYLIDTSALVRILRRQADAHWYECVARGLVALCEPVLLETLTGVDTKNFGRVRDDLRDAYPWVGPPDDAWPTALAVQQDLAKTSQHQGLSVADHLVIATAIKARLVLLHEDADFETVAKVVPQLRQQRLSEPLTEQA